MPPRAFLQQRILYKLHTVRVNLVVSASFRYWFSVRLRPFFLSFAFLIFLNKATELCSCIGNIVGIFPLFFALFRCFHSVLLLCLSCSLLLHFSYQETYATICSVFMEKVLHNCIILQIVQRARKNALPLQFVRMSCQTFAFCNKRIIFWLCIKPCANHFQPILNFIGF